MSRQGEKEKVLSSLSMGDRNRQKFFQSVFKILDQDESEVAKADTSLSNINAGNSDPTQKPINLSLNIFQSYDSLKKKTQTLSNSKSKSILNHSYVETETNIVGRTTQLKKLMPGQTKRSVPPLHSSLLKKN